MNPSQRSPVPSIVHIILSQLARMRSERTISDCDFETRLTRIEREELAERGLRLLRRELAGGTMRFCIKEITTGTVCETIEYPGKSLEPEPVRIADNHLRMSAKPRRLCTSSRLRLVVEKASELNAELGTRNAETGDN
jgi:hypothetical protein